MEPKPEPTEEEIQKEFDKAQQLTEEDKKRIERIKKKTLELVKKKLQDPKKK